MGRYIPTTYNEEPPGVMFLTPGGSESDQSMNTVIQLPQISVQGLLEDILEKDSSESYFIQMCDFISCFTNLYYKYVMKEEDFPKRIGQVVDKTFVSRVFATLEAGDVLNLKASSKKHGLVIYPRA